jgi:putative transposase
VSDNQAEFPIATMCRLLGVSPSGYYAWTKRQPSRRAQTDTALVAEIRAARAASRGIYGAPRIHVDLAAKGIRVGRKRIARLMSRRKFVTTTVKGSDRQAPDLVDRNSSYDLFGRSFLNGSHEGNPLYLHDREFVKRRVRSASAIKVVGQSI